MLCAQYCNSFKQCPGPTARKKEKSAHPIFRKEYDLLQDYHSLVWISRKKSNSCVAVSNSEMHPWTWSFPQQTQAVIGCEGGALVHLKILCRRFSTWDSCPIHFTVVTVLSIPHFFPSSFASFPSLCLIKHCEMKINVIVWTIPLGGFLTCSSPEPW